MICPTCGKGEINALVYEDIQLHNGTGTATRGGVDLNLTKTEYRLLEYFMTNRHVVLSPSQIYAAVWNGVYEETPTNTVLVHICTLRKKLGDPPVIRTLRGRGWMMKI